MSTEWQQFSIVLESKGLTFEQIKGASDRTGVLAAMGFTDPLKVAILETEWRRRVGDLPSTAGGGRPALATSSSTAAASSYHVDASSGSRGSGPSPARGATSTTSVVFSSAARTGQAGSGSGHPTATTAITREEARALLQQPDRTLAGIPEELQDTVLTAEVLAAALGFGGTYIQLGNSSSSSSGTGFTVSSKVPLSMRGLCQTILPVADAFVALREVEKSEYTGKTLVAMALGEVISEVCTSYAHEITKLTRWSEDKTMPLMGAVSEVLRVGQHMMRLRQLLPMDLLLTNAEGEGGSLYGQQESPAARARMVDTYNSLLGTRILNHLSGQAERSALSSEEEELRMLLLRRSLVPYLRVLHQWMHAGVLEDPYGEFFITENYEPASRTSRIGALSATQRQHTRRLFPEAAFFALYGLSGGNEVETSLGQQEVVAFERRFSMNKKMIPSILEKPGRVAKMIFFAGKYCCLLREYNGSLPNFGEAAADMLVWTDVDDLHRKIQDSFEIASSAVIQLLFSPQIDLLGHINSLKSYFLQSRGDWMVSFLDSADELLSKSPDRVKVNSIRVLLQAAIARSCCNDPYHALIGCSFSDATLATLVQRMLRPPEGGGGGGAEGVELSLEASPGGRPSGRLSSGAVDSQQCVELLQLEVDLQWPLTLVLDAATQRRFNVIFRLLTAVKVCERRLCAVFFNNEVLATFSTAYGIKHQLVQFLQQFHFYATHFVLEPQWERLLLRLGQSDSVFGLSQALQDFFTQAERGLVLSSASRFRSLSKVIELANRLCEVGLHSSTATLPLIESTLNAIEDSFLQALSELSSPVGADYAQLVPLFTWIDFNGFYARHHVYHVQTGGAAAVAV